MGDGSYYYSVLEKYIISWFNSPGVIALSAIFSLLFLIFCYIIPLWKVFEKAGEKGWKAIVPIYNIYIIYKTFWKGKRFWIYLVLACSTSFFDSLADQLPENSILNVIASLIAFVLGILLIIETFKIAFRVSHAFGKSDGFGIGLALISFVFLMILGYGDAKLVENKEKIASENDTKTE